MIVALRRVLISLLAVGCMTVSSFAQDDEAFFAENKLLAEQGVASAQFILGAAYANGLGVPENDAEAVKWYRLAAEQGYLIAQYNLGVMYYNGQGVVQDYIIAHMWFCIAAANGYENAVESRDLTAKKMSSEDVSKAQGLARAWVNVHP